MSDTPPTPDDEPGVDDRAAEFALGILDREAHRAALARAEADPAFAAETLAWSERLSPLLDEIAPAAPSAGLWGRIQAHIRELGRSPGATELHARPVAAAASAALARSRGRWRALALTAIAASLACVLALGLLLAQVARPLPPMMIAKLASANGGPPITAAYDPFRKAVLLDLPGGVAPHGRTPELWVIDASGAPSPLGLARAGAVAILPLTKGDSARMRADITLAVSIEPSGGSPTGLPTGPVVATGKLRPA